jgi:hypothetical protein
LPCSAPRAGPSAARVSPRCRRSQRPSVCTAPMTVPVRSTSSQHLESFRSLEPAEGSPSAAPVAVVPGDSRVGRAQDFGAAPGLSIRFERVAGERGVQEEAVAFRLEQAAVARPGRQRQPIGLLCRLTCAHACVCRRNGSRGGTHGDGRRRRAQQEDTKLLRIREKAQQMITPDEFNDIVNQWMEQG